MTGLDDCRALLVLAEAPFAGAVLLVAIARLCGTGWPMLVPLAQLSWIVPITGLLIGLATLPVHPAPEIAWWQNGCLVGLRGLVAGGLIAFAGRRLTRGASASFAAASLALYVCLVTPIAFDWLVGEEPGHTVSAAGMMLAVQQIGAACGVALLTGRGSIRERQDLAKLLVAAAFGLSYLAFMDYLITWYGNLPARIGYYAVRGSPVMVGLAGLALAIGLFGTVAALATGRFRLGAAAALAGLALFSFWWQAAHWLAALVIVVAGLAVVMLRGRLTHG